MMTKTMTQDEREQNYSDYSDFYKSVHGIRPRWMASFFETASWKEMDEKFRILGQQADVVAKEEADREAQALAEFNAELADFMVKYGAGDRATALRWMTDGETFYSGQDVESWVWNRGILFTDTGRALVEELKQIVTYKDIN